VDAEIFEEKKIFQTLWTNQFSSVSKEIFGGYMNIFLSLVKYYIKLETPFLLCVI
jgi:hypothetical protein